MNGQNEPFEIFTLDPAVRIETLCFDMSGCGNQMEILFIPPDPQVVFVGGQPNDREARITLTLQNTTRQTTIKVTRAGQITIL